MKLLFGLITSVVLSASSYAQDVRVGVPIFSGSSCPKNAVQAVLSPDGTSISILFDQFSVAGERGKTYSPSDARVVRKCRFQIPVAYPRGTNIETTRLEYRGYASIPHARLGHIVTSGPAVSRYFGATEAPIVHTFGAMNDLFYVSHRIPQNFHGRCFPLTNIDFTMQVGVGGLSAGKGSIHFREDTRIDLDSIDLGNSGIEVGIRAVPCR